MEGTKVSGLLRTHLLLYMYFPPILSLDAELVISGNSFVSTQHCLLLRDEEGGKWVSDVSTNGTLLNGKRLEKNKRVGE